MLETKRSGIVWTTDDGEQVTVPSKFEVCDRCGGEGRHDHPAFSNGITSSEWAEWDDDDRETYMRGGYDVVCEECRGERVVRVVDEDRCDKELLEKIREWESDEADYRAYSEAERRYELRAMGCW